MQYKKKYILLGTALLVIFLLSAVKIYAAPPLPIPSFNRILGEATQPRDVAMTLEILFLLTVLTMAPALLMMTTAFIRVVIVLLIMQRALSLQQTPPRQVLISIALFITFFIMAPTFTKINRDAVQPYLDGKMEFATAVNKAAVPLRAFMFQNTREKDLALFFDVSNTPRPKTRADVPFYVLIPSFVLSEMKTGLTMGLLLFIPFIMIDMIVASTLLSMGMIMLPPIMISIPFKILIFVMVDGFNLITYQIVLSYQ